MTTMNDLLDAPTEVLERPRPDEYVGRHRKPTLWDRLRAAVGLKNGASR